MPFSIEPEIQDGQRALPKTQELFEGTGIPPSVPNPNSVGWYGTEISPLRGAFGLVREEDDIGDEFVGQFVKIQHAIHTNKSVTVYIIGEYPDLDAPICITRRAYAEIELLPLTPTNAYIEVIS
jgi:hypothetical protein